MRRVALLLAVAAAALMLASGVAIAKNFQGDGKDNRLVGTSNNDTIAGSGSDDNVSGKGGQDRVYGNSGADNVSGGADPDDVFGGKGADDLFGNGGDDYINSTDNRLGDDIDCGPGFDKAVIDSRLSEALGNLAIGEFSDQAQDNCEDVAFVIINPGVGTGSEDLSKLQRNEVDEAVEAGILQEVE